MTGKKIKAERIRAGIRPKQLAEMMNITKDELRMYEEDKLPVDVDTLIAFCNAIRSTPDRLTGYYKSTGIRTRMDDMGEDKLLTVYLDGWKCRTVDYTESGNIQLTFVRDEE